jgi:hypothetical protein
MSSELAESALATLRPGLDADGFDLRLGDSTSDSSVEVILEARPDACHDCLVPDEMLIRMIEAAIRSSNTEVKTVSLTKVGFDR